MSPDGSNAVKEIPVCAVEHPYFTKNPKKSKTPRPKFWCPLCGRTVDSENALVEHISYHENGSLLKCSQDRCLFETFSSKEMESHLKECHSEIYGIPKSNNDGGSLYKCVLCDFNSRLQRKVIIHVNCHYDKKGPNCFECSICKKQYNAYSALEKHKAIHSGKRPYKCEICGESFVYQDYLKSHIATHSQDKPFKCLICDAKFNKKVLLARHSRTHTGEKPYSCSFCSFKSNRSDTIKKHEIVNHSTDAPYKCSFCAQSFKLKVSRDRHSLTHIPNKSFKCRECDKSFKTKASFKIHCKNFGHHPVGETFQYDSASVPILQIESISLLD